jgi:predicted nucleic acid-binding protein
VNGAETKLPRALVDADLLINALFAPDPSRSAAAAILEEAERKAFVLVVSAQTLDEVARIASCKAWLVARIDPTDLDRFLRRVQVVAEVTPPLDPPLPRLSRDPGDDYLLAESIRSAVDVLVTRDRDVLDLGSIAGITILGPAAFLEFLRSRRES